MVCFFTNIDAGGQLLLYIIYFDLHNRIALACLWVFVFVLLRIKAGVFGNSVLRHQAFIKAVVGEVAAIRTPVEGTGKRKLLFIHPVTVAIDDPVLLPIIGYRHYHILLQVFVIQVIILYKSYLLAIRRECGMQYLVIIQQLDATRGNIIYIRPVQHGPAVDILALTQQQHFLFIFAEDVLINTKCTTAKFLAFVIKQSALLLAGFQVVDTDVCMCTLPVYLGIMLPVLHGIKAGYIFHAEGVVFPKVFKGYLLIALGKSKLGYKDGN